MRIAKSTPTQMSSVSKFFELTSPDQDDYFHLSLSPVPYMGNLRTADVFLLMINPSAGYADYITDAQPAFCQALSATRKQHFHAHERTCLALNPEYCESSWFSYYEKLFKPALLKCAGETGWSYLRSLEELSRRLAILELVPYYSARAGQITDRFIQSLTSTRKSKKAAQDLSKRAQRGHAIVILKWGKWDLGATDGIIRNNSRSGLSKEEYAAVCETLRKSSPQSSQ